MSASIDKVSFNLDLRGIVVFADDAEDGADTAQTLETRNETLTAIKSAFQDRVNVAFSSATPYASFVSASLTPKKNGSGTEEFFSLADSFLNHANAAIQAKTTRSHLSAQEIPDEPQVS